MKKEILIIFLFGILSINLYKTLNFLWSNLSVIKDFPNLSYNEKMHIKLGSYYDFMLFVKENTPETATILIPPDIVPWTASGNSFLDNYFLYPRKLINGATNDLPDLRKYSYVLIVWEDFNEREMEKIYGWPKVEILAKEVLYMDNNSTKIEFIRKGNYLPKEKINIGRYGLIKL